MFKKYVSMLMILGCVVGSLAGCGKKDATPNKPENGVVSEQDGNPYEKHLKFTVYSLDETPDFMEYPLVKEAKEKFNFDFEIQHVVWDNWDETTRTLVATDSLPEVLAWYNLNYSEYLNWVNQGVFKALPKDLSAYPELQKIVDKCTIFDKIKVDGDIYAFPKVNNNNPINNYTTLLYGYRKDWAEAIGYDFEPSQPLTYDEFVKFLEDIKEKDPGKLGDKLVPFDLNHGGSSWLEYARQISPYIDSYQKVDGKYVWGAKDPSAMDAIVELKELYDKGLLSRDSYTDKSQAGTERFTMGRSAVLYANWGPQIMHDNVRSMSQNIDGFTEEDFGTLVVEVPDGHYAAYQMDEFWSAFAFSSHCSDEIMERWLAVANWILEEEQVEKYAYGQPEIDWKKNSDGTIELLYDMSEIAPGEDRDYITNQRLFQKFFILEGLDVWLPNNPMVSSYLVNDVFKKTLTTMETNVEFRPIDYDERYFSAPYKDQYGNIYSITSDALMQAVLSDNPEEVWAKFIKDNEATVNLVLDELNAAFAE